MLESTGKWQSDKWFVSPYNYDEETTRQLKFSPDIQLHDVTLRDGEQQAGVVFTWQDKVRIAEALAEMGVTRIEAGMPSVSDDDDRAVREIAKRLAGVQVFAFARCMIDDVKRALDCGVAGIVVEIPSSKHVIERAYGWPVQKAIDLSIEATKYAGDHGLYTVFFPIDGTRAEEEWFFDMIAKVAAEGHMDALAAVDTFGGASPHGILRFISRIQERVQVPIEAHFHDDFGLAVANTLLALAAGVKVAHVTMSSLGERAGNAALEPLAVALRVLYGVDLGLKLDRIASVSRLVSELAGVRTRPNQPITGDALFRVESGIITSWLERTVETHPVEIFPYRWDLVGQAPPEVVVGKGSGKESIVHKLRALGLSVPPETAVTEILQAVKAASLTKRGPLTDDEFLAVAKGVAGCCLEGGATCRGN
ncbi:MAG: LeuA family protein [Bacillota bacterium]